MRETLKLVVEKASEPEDFRIILFATDPDDGYRFVHDIIEGPRTQVNRVVNTIIRKNDHYYDIVMEPERYTDFDFGKSTKLQAKVAKVVATLPVHDEEDY